MKAILVDDEPDGIRTLHKMLGTALPTGKSMQQHVPMQLQRNNK